MSVDGAGARSSLPPPRLVACLAATWLVWGSTYLAIKWARVRFPPFFQMGTRFLLAWSRGMRKAAMPSPQQWRNAFVVGTLMLRCGMGGTAVAEQSIGAGLVVAFIAAMPMMTVAVNGLFGVWPKRTELAGIVVGFLGVLVLTQGAGFCASPAALVVVTIACGGWAVGSVLSQRTFALAAGAMGYASQMLCGSVVLLEPAWATGQRPGWPRALTMALARVFLVVFGSLVAFIAYMVLLSRTSVALASRYSLVNPTIALLLGVAVGHETVSAQAWTASAIVLVGVALLLWQRTANRGVV